MPSPVLATGFVVDSPDEGTIFPSAGGSSGNPRVQAVYWRCLIVLFASARIMNPGLRLMLFSNVRPPVVDGHDLAVVLEKYGVELRLVPISTRLDHDLTPSWGNVLYFFDIMGSLTDLPPETPIALVDSDVLVAGALSPLFAMLDAADYAYYRANTSDDDYDINGLSQREMGLIASRMAGRNETHPIAHYGGELFLCSVGTWQRDRAVFEGILRDALAGEGAGAAVRTEEHVFSIAAEVIGAPVSLANGQIKRIWTSRDYNTVMPGDENLPLWHLPAEKRFGLHDLFRDLATAGFPLSMPTGQWRGLAQRRNGLPAKSATKVFRDSIRRITIKLGQLL